MSAVPAGTAGSLLKAKTVFRVVPRRWVVERSFAWLGRYLRLSKDYEYLVVTAQAWLRVAGCRLLIPRPGETAAF